ncbi:MAG: hydroxyacid dehydrogenase [Fusobacteria bacterium]|nr:hydroxyacid dehydrogenase [Fusobacteriota bacterium]
MKIVFLDVGTLGSGVSTEKISELGEYKTYNNTNSKELRERIEDVEVIITNKVCIGKNEIDYSKSLKLICVAATGYNNIDIEYAREKGITVLNVKNYSTNSVVQTVFSYILHFENQISNYDKDVKNGKWSKSEFFTLLKYNFDDLTEKTIGIIGYGDIGKKVKLIADSFGMNVLLAKVDNSKNYIENRVSLEEIFKKSDYITIHIPLNENTKNLITKDYLSMMKKDAVIINTARGGIINESDLYDALISKKIKGAAIDVMLNEPPKSDNKLFSLKNVLITPHIAWGSIQSRKNLIKGIYENISSFKKGDNLKNSVY